MTEILTSAVGQSLLSIGLYTVAFESMVLSFRGRMHEYLQAENTEAIPGFMKACKTADKTFEYCLPRLISFGVLAESEIEALTDMRHRRNRFAHEGYNDMMTLSFADVEADIQRMHRITEKVERWTHRSSTRMIGEVSSSSISPAIFGLYLKVAKGIACEKLNLRGDEIAPQ